MTELFTCEIIVGPWRDTQFVKATELNIKMAGKEMSIQEVRVDITRPSDGVQNEYVDFDNIGRLFKKVRGLME